MIYKLIINLILLINIFIHGMYNMDLFKMRYEIVIILLCISLSFYMYYLLKIKAKKLLLINIVYLVGITSIYPPTIVIICGMIIEYFVTYNYKYEYIAGTILIYLIVTTKLGIDYNIVILGIMTSIFVYSISKYEEKIKKLQKVNFELKTQNYNLQDEKDLENKMVYDNMEAIKVEERNEISQRLHDKIGHTLAGSIMQLEALKIIINKDKNKGLLMVDSVTNNLREGMDDIRETLRMIKPSNSEMNIQNLKVLIDKFANKSNIKTNLKIEGDLNEINIVYWKSITDCIREILTNTIKYSNGDLLTIEISVLNKIIRVYTKDNGYYKGNIKKGMGLIGIEERIINLNGSVSFNNDDGFSNLIILKR